MPNMLPSTSAATYVAGGFQPGPTQRPYAAALGSIVAVIPADDVVQMQARGWMLLPGSGTTAQRPSGPSLTAGTLYVDSTVPATIVWDGANWRNVITGATA